MSVIINETNFPDASFRSYVSTYYDADGDGILSDAEIAAVTEIDFSSQAFANLSGLEHFTSLITLKIRLQTIRSFSFNTLVNLRTLQAINCSKSNDLVYTGTYTLDFSYNTKLTSINLSKDNSDALNLGDLNQIMFDSALEDLYIYGLAISSLNFTNCNSIQSVELVYTEANIIGLNNKAYLTEIVIENYVDYNSEYAYSNDAYKGTALAHLDLSNNIRLAKLSIVANLANGLTFTGCSELKWLGLTCSNLSGELDLTAYNKLQWVNLAGNNLSNLYLGNKSLLQVLDVATGWGNIALSSIDITGCPNILNILNNEYTRNDVGYNSGEGLHAYKTVTPNVGLTYEIQIARSLFGNNGGGWTYAVQLHSSKDYSSLGYEIIYVSDLNNSDYARFAYNNYRTTLIDAYTPEIRTHPASIMVATGHTASFFVVSSINDVSYQWEYSDNNGLTWTRISGANAQTYSFTSSKSYNGALYHCVVSNAAGSVTSNSATLTVLDPPYITAQPTLPADVPANQSQTISVTATGDDVEYEWQESTNGSSFTRIPGATSSSYTIEHPEDYNGYYFRCYLYNDVSEEEVYSQAVRVHVVNVPQITTNLSSSKKVATGTDVTFTIEATGGSLSYAWYRKGSSDSTWTQIENSNSASYSFNAKRSDNGTKYYCVVSNAAGSVTSNSATLTVLDPPYITAQPTLPADVPANQSQTISVTATGDDVEYEWQESTNGSSFTRIPGATSSSYTIEHPEDYNGYYFRCYLYNDVSEVTSSAVQLHVVYIPTITNDLLEAYTVATGTDITFTIEATGGSLTYTWYRKGSSDSTWTQIENSNSASYSFNAKRSDSGTKYYCEVRNVAGNRNSTEATLTVLNLPEIITQPRIDSSIAENATVDISVTASGDDLSYQWQASIDGRTFADITNATALTYRITASSSNSGYYYRCHVYNGVGETDSNAVQLNVVYVPDITAELADISVKTNQIVTLSITATGGKLSYQWKRQEFNASTANNIPNATSDTYTFTAVKPTTGTKWIYSCEVENTAGKKTTSCTVTVLDAVAITHQPSLPAAIPLDSEQTLSVTATGDDIHYQWEVSSEGTNYSAISGANSATYAITASRENSKKYYRCKVYNDASSVFSAAIYLNAVSAPEIVTQLPETVVISTGRLVVLTIEATGESLTYTWYKQASNSSAWNKVSGATLPEYSFTAVKAESGSKYKCEVRNVDGFEMSSVATLTVLDPVVITSQPELPDEITINSINSISVTATGDDIHYQWEVSSDGTNFSAISGANSATYSVSATQTNARNSYHCRVYNDASESISDTVILNVIFTPQIVSESFPTNAIAHGTRITFSITAVGGGLSYYWQVSNDNEVSWENIVDAPNAPNYSFIASASQSGYRYRCIVENRVGKAFSSSATLNVISPPAILSAPASITVGNNTSASFSISASGSNLSFQWQESSNYGSSWTDIEDATSRTYSFTASIRQDAHQYRCKVWNDIDTLVSSAAVLTVLTVPSITVQPRSLTVSYANTAVFTISATGGNLSYQWEQRSSSSAAWQAINQNGTFPTYSFVAIDAEDGYQYRCLVKNSIGQVYSEVATLTVTPFEEPDAGDDSSVHEGEYLPSQMAEMIRSLIIDNTNLDAFSFGQMPNDTVYDHFTNPGLTDPKWYEDIAEAINEVKAFIESLELDE